MAMKHKAEIVIDADRATVWKMFAEPDNLVKWQPTLKSITLESGTAGETDAVSKLVYEENDREVVMTETITARREGSFLGGSYDSKWATVVIVNHFDDTENGSTRWTVNANYSFKGFMKILALFFRGSILRRTDADLNRFKLLVETSVGSVPA